MIFECDNGECMNWIRMAEPIFENMGINVSEILISISIKNNKYLEFASGKSISEQGLFTYNIIYIRNDLNFDCFIQTLAHEVGHITQIFGICENPKDYIKRIITESIAMKFEKEFLIMFNEKYNTNIFINTFYNTFIYRMAYHLRPLVILKTKSKYKSIKNDNPLVTQI